MPSLKPSRLRWAPVGRGAFWKPSMRHLICMAPRVCLAMSRSACRTTSWRSPQICSERSPWHSAAFRLSLGKVRMGVRRSGLALASPYRSSKSEAPTPTVTVSASAGTSGPRMPLSDGGAPTPRSAGAPPAVRKRARSVMVRSRSARSARLSAMTSRETKAAAAGCGVRMPAWWAPWKGTCPARRRCPPRAPRWRPAWLSAKPPPARTAPAAPAPRAVLTNERRPAGQPPCGAGVSAGMSGFPSGRAADRAACIRRTSGSPGGPAPEPGLRAAGRSRRSAGCGAAASSWSTGVQLWSWCAASSSFCTRSMSASILGSSCASREASNGLSTPSSSRVPARLASAVARLVPLPWSASPVSSNWRVFSRISWVRSGRSPGSKSWVGNAFWRPALSSARRAAGAARSLADWPCHRPYSTRWKPVKSLSFTPSGQSGGAPVDLLVEVLEGAVGGAERGVGAVRGEPVGARRVEVAAGYVVAELPGLRDQGGQALVRRTACTR